MSLTEEDVRRIISESHAPKIDPNAVQWLVRSAYEEAWRAAGGDPSQSHHADEPKGWRLAWLGSKVRSVLIRNGMISGEDSYK